MKATNLQASVMYEKDFVALAVALNLIPFWRFEPARVKPNGSSNTIKISRMAGLTASAFNLLGQYTVYTSSAACRAYCYAELAIWMNIKRQLNENDILIFPPVGGASVGYNLGHVTHF